MKLKLSLRRGTSQHVHLLVTADSIATVEDVAREIVESVPVGSRERVDRARLTLAVVQPGMTEPIKLDPTSLLGDAPIGSGFEATVIEYAAKLRPRTIREAAAVMTIHSGPKAGRAIPLATGATIIGRADTTDVVIADQLISKQHVRVEVGQGIELIDLNSANGLVVDGGHVQRLRVRPGQIVTIGATDVSFALSTLPRRSNLRVLERGGSIMFNRAPRVEDRYPSGSTNTRLFRPRLTRGSSRGQ